MPRARKFGGLPTLTLQETLSLSQDAFAALRPTEQKCTPRRKRSILLAFSALAANVLLSPPTNDPMSLSKQNVLIQQTKGR